MSMTKIIIKHAIVTLLCAILFFGLFLLWTNAVMYYDVVCVAVATIPVFLVVRFFDDYIRDVIIIINDNKTGLATVISGIILLLAFIAAAYVYVSVLKKPDIYVTIFDALDNILPVTGIRDKFGIY